MHLTNVRHGLAVLCFVGVAACSGDSSPAPVAPEESKPDPTAPPLMNATFDCDAGLRVRMRSASFGSPTKAFIGRTLSYDAIVEKTYDNTVQTLYATPVEWTTFRQLPRLNVGAPSVDIGSDPDRIINQMSGVSEGRDSIRIRVGVTGGSLYRAACDTIPIDVESGTAYRIAFMPTSGFRTPVDRPVSTKVSAQNNRYTGLPQSTLTFSWISGAAATVTRQNDSVFLIQPHAQGAATLRASFEGLNSDYVLNVCEPSTQATYIKLSSLADLYPGETRAPQVDARNCVGGSITTGFTWRSSNTSVAAYSAGQIHAYYPGTTYIVVARDAVKDSVLLRVRMREPQVQGSVVYDPSYPTGQAHLSWASVVGASSYQIWRKCRMSDGYSPGWELWDSIADVSYTAYDYVTRYAGTGDPGGSYMAYYVVAVGSGVQSFGSEVHYFSWDEEAEPGC